MNFEFSPHIAIQVKNYEAAVDFYENILGLKLVHQDANESEFRCGGIALHVERNDDANTFFEFKVENIAEAVTQLKKIGCKVTGTSTPEGFQSYIVSDPFGMKFHLWEEGEE